MFSLNGTLKKSGSIERWETKLFIGICLTGSFHFKIYCSKNEDNRSVSYKNTPCSVLTNLIFETFVFILYVI